MPKLTDTQLVIMSAAAARDDHAVLPLPKSIKIRGGAVTIVLKSLLKRDLVAEQAAGRGRDAWRQDGDKRLTLVITVTGLGVIGVEPDQSTKRASAGTSAKSKQQRRSTAKAPAGELSRSGHKAPPKPGTKKALLVDLLARKRGATIAEIGEATGWQPHSVRGAISGAVKKNLGLNVASEAIEGRGRVYRIVARA